MTMEDWNFVQSLDSLSYPALSFIFLIGFVVVMPLLFINLLVIMYINGSSTIRERLKLVFIDIHSGRHRDGAEQGRPVEETRHAGRINISTN